MSYATTTPLSVLTGFLGSGKTTVLNRLLRHPAMARTLVILNEFGEIGLDHDLIESATDDMVLLQSGCLCCTVRSDLIDTLSTLLAKRERGEVRRFDRVVIETTGLADPAPILNALMTDRQVTGTIGIRGVITVVDALAGEATLDRHMEAVKQVAVSDRILLTKTDLADETRCASVVQRVRGLNPAAPITRSLGSEFVPDALFDDGLYDPSTKAADVQRWLAAERYAQLGDEDAPRRPGNGVAVSHDHAGHDVNRHDDHIRATCMVVDEPIPGEALDRWLNTLFLLKGPDLLRFKGIINVMELEGPLVIHGVQHFIHPPIMLKRWPSEDRRTRIVFITHDIDASMLRASLMQFIDSGTTSC